MVGLPLTMIKDALNSFLVNHVRNPHGTGTSSRSRFSAVSPILQPYNVSGVSFLIMAAVCAQRKNDIALLKWGEVKGDTIEIAGERMKGRQTHVVPLSVQAAAIIEAQRPHVAGGCVRSLIEVPPEELRQARSA
jgi:hypothetical protein